MMETPWLTVVTAVRDDVSGLSRTLESLGSHGDSGVEVLVVDSSADRDSVIEAVAGRAHVHWMKPEGIYPAMNAGLGLARGTYIQFLNAGDTLNDHEVLTRVKQKVASLPVWMFGRVEIISTSGIRAVTPAWDYQEENSDCSVAASSHSTKERSFALKPFVMSVDLTSPMPSPPTTRRSCGSPKLRTPRS